MQAVFDLLRSRRIAIPPGTTGRDAKAKELVAAKEILAEVFGIRISEVEEMIANRSTDRPYCQKEKDLWPREFELDG
ncbi:MAG: hypothetical protein A4E49_01453 [Methanosaeta sp. PtaU1.Bin112]|nr:MAG: hypothetical protein A4E49_01453 [Methanosaeta sp. PtaU1.Bin112]